MATAKQISVVVITPERKVLEETADSVVIPAHDGELGVLSSRAPLMCELGTGVLRYEQGGSTHRMLVDGGFAQVNDNRVTVLTDDVVSPAEVTDDMIAAAEKAAEALTGSDEAAVASRARVRRKISVLRGLKSAR